MRLTLLLLGTFFCAAAGAQDRLPRIIQGAPTDLYPAVGIVGQQAVGGFCTGTLISPYHVLTAAHCAEFLLELGPQDSGTFAVGGQIYRTGSVQILESYNARFFADDVAILVLAEPVTGVAPMELSTRAPEVGESVVLVGFGGQGTAESGSDGSFGEKAIGFTQIDAVTANEISWRFDDPNESNPAPGDSGGPVIVETADGPIVVGIVSSGTTESAGLGDTTFSMRVDAYEPWITETVLATMPLAEPEEDPPTADPDEAEESDQDPNPDPPADEDADEACAAGNPGEDGAPGRKPGKRPGVRPGKRPGVGPGRRPGGWPGKRPGAHGRPNWHSARLVAARPGSRHSGRRPVPSYFDNARSAEPAKPAASRSANPRRRSQNR